MITLEYFSCHYLLSDRPFGFVSLCKQALMNYAGSRNSVEHGLPLLEVYCLSINCFAAARPHLTADSDNVALVLKRLAL